MGHCLHSIRTPLVTRDQFDILLAELICDAEEGNLSYEDLIEALENVVAAIRENEAE